MDLPDGNGIDLCRSIRSARPDIRCLMLTAYDEDSASLAAVLAGASGYVIKNVREQQALQLITEGLTNRQIGEHLGLAEKTVKNYVSGLPAKRGMERRTQVAAYGARRGGPGKRQPSRDA